MDDLHFMDMIALRELDISGQGIRSLKGLEVAINLHRLDARKNRLTDIRPLIENTKIGGMRKGARIDLTGNDLDTSKNSPTFQDINTLRARGVIVSCD